MIRAKGKILKMDYTVEYDNKQFMFNGEKDSVLEKSLKSLLKSGIAILGGTYIPENPYELVNIYEILHLWFFDDRAEMWTDEHIPPIGDKKKGRIY